MAYTKTVRYAEALRLASDNGDAYSWSTSYNYAGLDTILILRNDSGTRNLHVDNVIVASDATTQVIVQFVNDPGGAMDGTVEVVGVNLNIDSAKIADAYACQDEITAPVQADVISDFFMAADVTGTFQTGGAIILGHLDCIGVDFVTIGTMGCVTIIGHYEDAE